MCSAGPEPARRHECLTHCLPRSRHCPDGAAGVRETAEDRERDRVRRDYAGALFFSVCPGMGGMPLLLPAWLVCVLLCLTLLMASLFPTNTDKYEGADMRVDSHWSEKKREHMTERDWRIFRSPIWEGSGCRRPSMSGQAFMCFCVARVGLCRLLTVAAFRACCFLLVSREDFSISYKGVNPALPIRNWDEGNLPKSLRKVRVKAGPVNARADRCLVPLPYPWLRYQCFLSNLLCAGGRACGL